MTFLRKRILVVTGFPGFGKTTVLMGVAETLRLKGFNVGGMTSRDVRVAGARVGFEVLDLATGRKGGLASIGLQSGPRVGAYRVNVDDLNNVGSRAVADAAERSDIIIIDEIGPMELFSERFRESVMKAVSSGKPVVLSAHRRIQDSLIESIKRREDAVVYTVTMENRNRLGERISREVLVFLSDKHKNKVL